MFLWGAYSSFLWFGTYGLTVVARVYTLATSRPWVDMLTKVLGALCLLCPSVLVAYLAAKDRLGSLNTGHVM